MNSREKKLIDHIKTKLPLNKAVKVTFTPTKSGELKYGCGMNKMIGGVLTTLPVVLIFMVIQKALVQGLTAGALKS